MSVHPASHLLVLSHLLCQTPLVQSQAGLSQSQSAVPGIAAWQAAIQQHALVEGRAVPKKEGEVPGMANWEAHQRAVLEAERKLNQSYVQGTVQQRKREEKVNTKTSSGKSSPKVAGDVRASISRLLAKLSGKEIVRSREKSKVEILLEESRKKKIKKQPREESFLDKLIKTYSHEERENALKAVGKNDNILQALQERRKNKLMSKLLAAERSRAFRKKTNQDRFSFLNDYYDQGLPSRKESSQISSLRVLSGDYLDLLFEDDDYDYEDSYEKVSNFHSNGRLSSAARDSRLIERQLINLLRNN